MKKTLFAIALLAAFGARAEVYSLALTGSGFTLVDGHVCCGAATPIDGARAPFQWSGNVLVSVDSIADGIYGGARVTSFASSAQIDGAVPYAIFGFNFSGDGFGYGSLPYATLTAPVVTISGGQIASIVGSLRLRDLLSPNFSTITFAGLSVSQDGFFWRQGTTHARGDFGAPPTVARYAVPIAPVPEPSLWVLMGMGGLLLACRRRLRAR